MNLALLNYTVYRKVIQCSYVRHVMTEVWGYITVSVLRYKLDFHPLLTPTQVKHSIYLSFPVFPFCLIFLPNRAIFCVSEWRKWNRWRRGKAVRQWPMTKRKLEKRLKKSEKKSFQKLCAFQCQICFDTASGCHFGVLACEGCKVSFTVRKLNQGSYDF